MPRKKVTSRFRGTDIFSRRIVITVTRSGIAIIALAIVIGLVKFPFTVVSTVSLLVALLAIITTVEARHQLRTFRYEMQERITAQLSDWFVPEDLPDLREVPIDDDDFEEEIRRISLRRRNAPNN